MNSDPIPPRVEELFERALATPPETRAEFLASECDGNDELAIQVSQLLDAHDTADDGFLQPPSTNAFLPGEIGGFRVLHTLGAGGMGTVYEARQERPQRTVALKVVRALTGSGDPRRFEHEAEMMARLQHPGVAQLFEAGTQEDAAGTLIWFAMELVPGARTLLDYATAEGLGLDAKLALFRQAAEGVAHGHRRGVLHRDLKPDNVLVDSSGRVKIIDFGIARATGREDRDWTFRAKAGDLIGTLPYMSPEQCSGEDVDTRADVYALGVVLYELLSGARPLTLEGHSITRAVAVIQDERPTPPSRHAPELAGELEAVLLKTIEKDPADRYATVEALLDDLARYQARVPVLARPPGRTRAMLFFARRHAGALAALAIVLAALIGAVVVSTNFGLEARRSAQREQTARIHAERIAEYLTDIFVAARPATPGQADLQVRDVLAEALRRSESDLAEAPQAQADVLETLGLTIGLLGDYHAGVDALRRVVDLREANGDPTGPQLHSALGLILTKLNRFAEAEVEFEAALIRLRTDAADDQALLALTLVRQASVFIHTGRTDEAEAALEEALSLARDGSLSATIGRALEGLGDTASAMSDLPAAEGHYRSALDAYERELPADHITIGIVQNNLASVLFKQGQLDEAAERWRVSLDILERAMGEDHPDVATVLGNLALIHQRRRDFETAIPMYELSLERLEQRLGRANVQVGTALRDFGWMYVEKGDLDRAEVLLTEALEVYRAALGDTPDATVARAHFNLAVVLFQTDQLEEAEAVLADTVAMMKVTYPPAHPELAGPLTLLGNVLLKLERPAEAEEPLRRAWTIRSERLPEHWLTANTASVLGECLAQKGAVEEGLELLVPARAALEKALGTSDFRTQLAIERVNKARALLAGD